MSAYEKKNLIQKNTHLHTKKKRSLQTKTNALAYENNMHMHMKNVALHINKKHIAVKKKKHATVYETSTYMNITKATINTITFIATANNEHVYETH